MKKKVLIDVHVICEPPASATRWAYTVEQQARQLEEWCREFEEFVRDHRSQDPVSLSVQRQYEERCSHCGRQWEEDADGPVCCDKAQQEWDEAKAAA